MNSDFKSQSAQLFFSDLERYVNSYLKLCHFEDSSSMQFTSVCTTSQQSHNVGVRVQHFHDLQFLQKIAAFLFTRIFFQHFHRSYGWTFFICETWKCNVMIEMLMKSPAEFAMTYCQCPTPRISTPARSTPLPVCWRLLHGGEVFPTCRWISYLMRQHSEMSYKKQILYSNLDSGSVRSRIKSTGSLTWLWLLSESQESYLLFIACIPRQCCNTIDSSTDVVLDVDFFCKEY